MDYIDEPVNVDIKSENDLKSIFGELRKIDLSGRSKSKQGLSYVPWATAYDEACKRYNVEYEIRYFDNKDGGPDVPYLVTPIGLMVETSVTLDGNKVTMQLPVMDSSNRSMRLEPYSIETRKGPQTVQAATMMDVNKALMRCLTKNIAMFGLGLNMWTSEDVPEAIVSLYKLHEECVGLINQKHKAASEAGDNVTKEKIATICKTTLPEECNGDPSLCDDEDTLKELKKKLMAIRISKKN